MEKKYNAFISYKHTEPDIYVATQIQRKLEHFRLPKSLRKKYPKEKWRINRVFRDQDELSLADNLSDELDNALKSSEFLIAICTPRFKESEWCNRETEIYKELYGLEHMLLVLAEGEPEDSFPPTQWYRDKETTDEKGNQTIVREDVEPLAADVRALDKKTLDKKINDAVIRLAAQMYGMDYDELKRRHREQKIHLIAKISGICAVVFLVFGLICFFLLMKINSLNTQLEDANSLLENSNIQLEDMNKKIQGKNEELEDLNRELQEQYSLEQEKYAKSMAQVSGNLMKEGLRLDSIYAIRNAMPSSRDDKTVPYVASAEYALSCALFTYDAEILIPVETIPMTDDEEFWGTYDEYRFLESCFADDYIIGVGRYSDSEVLVITAKGNYFLYNEGLSGFFDVSKSLFADKTDLYINCAVYRDKKLYVNYANTNYIVCYEYKEYEDKKYVSEINVEDYREQRGRFLKEGDEALSDDGKYRIKIGPNKGVYIYEAEGSEPVQILYDIQGFAAGLKRLEGTEYYALTTSGVYSIILDRNLEKVARVPAFYGYSKEDNRLLCYKLNADDKTVYDIFSIPLKNYDELVKEADELLNGYTPSDEILKKYEMLE